MIANTISLLKISDFEHFHCCYHENFKFQLFFEFMKIAGYEGKVNKIFDEKHEELMRLFRKFEVFIIKNSLFLSNFIIKDRKTKEKSRFIKEKA